MRSPDEAALGRRLHEEMDLPDFGPAPLDVVFRRSRAMARRRLAEAACAVVVVAAAAWVVSAQTVGRPSGPPGPSAGGPSVFASGTADGRPWQLAVVNLADPGYGCLPGVVLNGADGDLLQAGILPGLGNVAFLEPTPGRPGPGWAFVRLRPGVRDVRASLSGGATIGPRIVAVRACGTRFRLAGFEYPRGVLRIAARSAGGRPVGYRPDADLFRPASSLQTGQWFNVQAATNTAASGVIGSGRLGRNAWRLRVTLGPNGECLTVGPAGDPGGWSASICGTVGEPPGGASLQPLPYAGPHPLLIWYAGAVNPRTAYAVARLSDGSTRRIAPAIVGGRKYVAVGTEAPAKLVRLTLYGPRGRVIASVAPSAYVPSR